MQRIFIQRFHIKYRYVDLGSLKLGRTEADAPDAWCFLCESYLKTDKRELKNFERWVYQRDTIGYEKEPVVKIMQPIEMWMVEPGKYYDYIARTRNKIGFKGR